MKTAPVLFSLFFGLSACVSTYYYSPAATQPGQKEAVYTRGLPGLRSQQFGADLTAGLSARGEKDLSLMVYIYNDSDSAYTFYPEDVKVTGYDAFNQSKPLRVFGAQEYIRWKNTRDILIASAVVIGTVAAVVAVSEATGGSDRPSRPAEHVSRADRWAIALDWIDFSMYAGFAIAANNQPPPEPSMPEDGLLRTHTIYPGEAIQGIVKIRGKANFMQHLLVEVPVNGAYHKFVFEHRTPVR
ncbi:MAG: hypothetical protein L6Q97_02070 [Thermoanaerobaculia bacterium]|nr:hypothetical protein [Thermoanaerobaculia bacterium]